MNNFTKTFAITMAWVALTISLLVVGDRLFPKTEYSAERIESIYIQSNGEQADTYYVHFKDWMYEGIIDARPGDIVLVVYTKSRLFNGAVFDKEIHTEFKIKD